LEWFISHSPQIHKHVNDEGLGCLHLAARENRIAVIQYLISIDKDNLIDMEKAPNGNSPLHFYVRNHPNPEEENFYFTVLDELINYMKSQHVSDNPIEMHNLDGETPLHAACLKSNEFVIRFLMERGANVNVQSSTGETPLHYAVRYCNFDSLMNIFNSIPIGILKTAVELKGVEGTIVDLAQKYKPQVLPILDRCNH